MRSTKSASRISASSPVIPSGLADLVKIERISLHAFRLPYRQPYKTAAGTAADREGLICQLQTETGIIGLGECSYLPHDLPNIDDVIGAAEVRGRAALGMEVDAVINSSPGGGSADSAARCGIEMAAWDALARAKSLPLARLLNPEAALQVAVNALLSDSSVEESFTGAQKAVASGFRTLKLKVGIMPGLAAEQSRVAAVRKAIGTDIKLRLDANGAWGEDLAEEMLTAFASHDIEYVEQPIAPGNFEAMRRLRSNTAIKIALDEDVTGLETARSALAAGAADFLILKPIALGGVGPTIEVARAARAGGVAPVITTSIDSGVGTAAALHLAAALAGGNAAGLAALDLLSSHLLTTALSIDDGSMAVPSKFGLGVELDAGALKAFAQRQLEIAR